MTSGGATTKYLNFNISWRRYKDQVEHFIGSPPFSPFTPDAEGYSSNLSTNVLDLNNDGLAVGTSFEWTHTLEPKKRLSLIKGNDIIPLRLAVGDIESAFINDDSDVAFSAFGPTGSGELRAYRYRWQGTFERLPLPVVGALRSKATGIDSSGDIPGEITLSSNQILPVVWTSRNEIIDLVLPEFSSVGIATGLTSLDLVWGTVYVKGKYRPAIWKEQKLFLPSLRPGEQCFQLVCLNDGTPVATILKSGVQVVKQLVGTSWVPLNLLVTNLPKETVFYEVKYRSSNEKLVVFGKGPGGTRYYVLTPIPSSRPK